MNKKSWRIEHVGECCSNALEAVDFNESFIRLVTQIIMAIFMVKIRTTFFINSVHLNNIKFGKDVCYHNPIRPFDTQQ